MLAEEGGEVRLRDKERTRKEILKAATEVFAISGFASTRMEDVAKRTRATQGMIYYYFGSKKNLYLEVMENAFGQIRAHEQSIDVEGLSPSEALRTIAEQTYDYHTAHPEFVRLVAIENIHRAENLISSEVIPERNKSATSILERVLARGVAVGEFRSDLDAIDVHKLISSYSFDHVANGYTFRALFGRDIYAPELHEHYRKLAGDMIVATLTAQIG